MSERDDRPSGEGAVEDQQFLLAQDLDEGAGPGIIGAADGVAGAGSVGAAAGDSKNAVMPDGPPDLTVGPD
ncbi:MAG: hypothetical protein ACRDTF_16180 [Pseudonocardiaceae bacterium]